MTEKRFLHTMNVAWEAVGIAERLGADKGKAYIAGLLHDCAKDVGQTPEAFKDIGVETYDGAFPQLSHGPLGAKIARELGVNDEDILNAITYHSTGRKEMSLLEKITFVADAVEPGRPEDAQREIRAALDQDINGAVVSALKRKFEYCARKGQSVHPLGREALSYYESLKN
ncbi:MAG: bis(5'-nucleosyl)-tetraphosphatase (symmetrical) YqeK [Clostridiales bacterium]|nr:bis(5'-nucleosyl)-tetraphosphatase (symmetrical) YqeK [Clostridiales bacterium]